MIVTSFTPSYSLLAYMSQYLGTVLILFYAHLFSLLHKKLLLFNFSSTFFTQKCRS